MSRLLLALPLALALSGCSLAPDYARPAAPVPQSWPAGDAYLAQAEAALPEVSYRDVFLQIGLLTTMGLASKNAILMIEFAEHEEQKGARVIDAVLTAARIRLRPILMTSFAFIFGVLPLALATGAGANSRIAIGTSVIGGMLTASLLAVFFIPLLFVLVRRGTREGLKALHARFARRGEPDAAA